MIGLDKTGVSKIETGARAVTAKEVVALADYFLISTEFPYTAKGEKAAKSYAKRTGKKMVVKKGARKK